VLSSLIYTSKVSELGPSGLQGLLDQARRRNASECVTGLLVFNRHHFLQYLEGGREQVTNIFGRIAADPRHSSVCLLSVRDLDERSCPDWTMAYLGSTRSLREIYRRFMVDESFEPNTLSADGARGFVNSIVAHFSHGQPDAAEAAAFSPVPELAHAR
jgi:hypothetical protein